MLQNVLYKSFRQYPQIYGPYRLVRSVVRRDETRSKPKLLKGKFITLDNEMGDEFGPVEHYADLNRILKKMIVDPEEVESEAEQMMEDYNSDTVIEKSAQYAQMHKQEQKDYDRMVQKKITKRKFFKELKETNLLTYSAKKQIRYLNTLDPKEWTPQKISECFPISVEGAKKLVKNNFEFRDEERIKNHDLEVLQRWKMLENNQNLTSISPVTLQLYREGKLIRDYYSGNVSLPQPMAKPETYIKPQKKVGEHLAIVKKYIDIKKNSNLETTRTDAQFNADIAEKDKKILNQVLPDFSFKYPTRFEMEDQISASYLATSIVENFDADMPYDQYEQNLLEEYTSKEIKTPTDTAYLDWLKKNKKSPITDEKPKMSDVENNEVFLETVKKHSFDSIELIRGDSKDNQNVPYMYDSKIGYQYPLGRNTFPVHIKIPQHLVKKGSLYRVGQCYYDDTGEFLYRIPVNVKKT